MLFGGRKLSRVTADRFKLRFQRIGNVMDDLPRCDASEFTGVEQVVIQLSINAVDWEGRRSARPIS